MSFGCEVPCRFYHLIGNFSGNFKDDVKEEKGDMTVEACGRGYVGCSNESEEISEE
jgi:hypothetical protein